MATFINRSAHTGSVPRHADLTRVLTRERRACAVERTILESLLTDLGDEYVERAQPRKRERAEARVAG